MKPAQWRNTGEEVRFQFYYEAFAASRLPFRRFTLHLDHALIAEAYAAPSFISYFHDRVRPRVEKALGRKVEFCIALEETWNAAAKRHQPHLHGLLQVSEEEKELSRAALLDAAGRWQGEGRKRQLRFGMAPAPDWPSYPAKDFWKERMRAWLRRYNAGPGNVLSFEGAVVSATNPTKREAERIYNAVTGRTSRKA